MGQKSSKVLNNSLIGLILPKILVPWDPPDYWVGAQLGPIPDRKKSNNSMNRFLRGLFLILFFAGLLKIGLT